MDYFGKASANYTYDAFGNQTSSTEEVYNPFRYCGEYFDEESGLIYLRNRYYDPSIGAFITEDPARDGLNWYSYCCGNPIMFVDPWGLVQVLLRYALRDIGATDISWNNDSKIATFSYKGKQMNVGVEAENIINGRSIVDSYGLAHNRCLKSTSEQIYYAWNTLLFWYAIGFDTLIIPQKRRDFSRF